MEAVTVFLDADGDEQLDPAETSTVTDASGHYEFAGLTAAQQYTVVEIPPTGHYQTFPDVIVHTVTPNPGEILSGLDFGNAFHLELEGQASGALAPIGIERASVDSDGNQTGGLETYKESSISADGRFVAFSDIMMRGSDDIYVYDRNTGRTTVVSVDSSGNPANGSSGAAAISADGRFVVFQSHADNLVEGYGSLDHGAIYLYDRNTGETTGLSVDSAGASWDLSISAEGRFVAFHRSGGNYVHDRHTGETTIVSLDSSGNPANGAVSSPVISADGRFVAFGSDADNLVGGDTNGFSDIFVHDRQTGETTRVSVDSSGHQATNGASTDPSISANGRFVAFNSWAASLVAGDTNGVSDIFIHDRQTGKTTRVSVDSGGNQANGRSFHLSVSADGRFVAFGSRASNLVSGDTNWISDTFVHDRHTGVTTRISVDSNGNEAIGGHSGYPSISADGRFVAFTSRADDLVVGDTNSSIDLVLSELTIPNDGSSTDKFHDSVVVVDDVMVLTAQDEESLWGANAAVFVYGHEGTDWIETANLIAVKGLYSSSDWISSPGFMKRFISNLYCLS